MTIIHIINSIAGGGAEQMVLQLTKRSRAAHKTVIISLSDNTALEDKFLELDLTVHYLGIDSFKNSSLFKGLKKIRALIQNETEIVFHCHQFHAGLLGMIYKLFYNIKAPIVFTLHTNSLDAVLRRIILFITKPLRHVDIIFSPNSIKWYLKNNAVLPNGVDFKVFSSTTNRSYDASKPFNFLFLGRINKPKNPLYLIKVVNKLIASGKNNFLIHVVGDGDLMNSLKEQISESKIDQYFKLYGYQDKVTSYLYTSHCLILPSIREGMPIAILEAAATKLPVIATPVGSIPDFLNNTNAIITEISQFTECMSEVMSNYSEALLRSEILYKEILAKFDIELVYNEHLKIYKSLI